MLNSGPKKTTTDSLLTQLLFAIWGGDEFSFKIIEVLIFSVCGRSG